ncbi:MAG: AsmA-like C-terminal region-containing protein, partial [Thermoguttaceae bacterium]
WKVSEDDPRLMVQREPGEPQPGRFAVSGRLSHGRIDDRRLPYPLTDARASFRVSEDGFAIDELTAQANEATVRMACRRSGFGRHDPMHVNIEVRKLELSRSLVDALPEPMQEQWYQYRPAGRVDVDVDLVFDGRTWLPTVQARLLDVSFTHFRFPYRLERGVGTVHLTDGNVQVNVHSYSGDDPVRIDAEITDALGEPYGWLRVQGDAVPLDEKLLVALPDGAEEVVRSLQPRGTIRVDYRMWRERPEVPMQQYMLVELNRCAIRFDKFPYPVRDIGGVLEMRDDRWQFRELQGRNDAGWIVGYGHLEPRPEGREFQLTLEATGVPLEGELRDALTPNVRSLWEDLRPRGVVDVSAEIRYLAEKRHLSLTTRIRPQADTTSIEPVRFPYRMEKLQGEIAFRDGRVSFDRLEAEHGAVHISTAGDCEILPDGRWLLRLSGLSVDRLRFDRDLVQALPGGLRKSLAGLNPAGMFNLRGSVDLAGGVRADDRMQAAWDLRVGFHQASIDCGVKLENMHGGLTLVGRFDGARMASTGELDLDSLTYKDFQFTQVTGPLWIDDRQVLLGSWVERRRAAEDRSSVRARPISAAVFDGVVQGDAWATLGPVPRWGLHATLDRADLARCAQEMLTGEHTLQGKVNGTLDLRGAGPSTNAMVGHGAIQLDSADVYELPLMIALLKILSVRQPDRNAFSRSDIRFRVEGQHVYFDQIDFSGDAISLLGKGEMDFHQNIRMTFHAIVGRGELGLPLLKQVVGGASQQIMLIHVAGTLQQPETRREAFPVVNKALQQLQDDLNAPPEPTGWFPKNLFRWR